MFEQTFKNIDDILYKDAGADSELDYIGQTSWILFLKYLDDLEKDRSDEAELKGEKLTSLY
jgi:type I restriction enzyme M protein